MFSFIGTLIKYSLLVLTILILSHIIEIQSVTISQHVLNGMHWISGYSPKSQVTHLSNEISHAVQSRVGEINKIDAEVSRDDQKALNNVIQKSQGKR
jgi:hypothetical protein